MKAGLGGIDKEKGGTTTGSAPMCAAEIAGAARRLRIPMGSPETPAVTALRDKEGIVKGRDYRGIVVMPLLQAAPGLGGATMSKVCAARIYAPLAEHAWSIGITVFLLLVILALVLRRDTKRQQAAQEIRRLNERLERYTHEHGAEPCASHECYRTLIENSPDVVILADLNGGIVMASPAAVVLCGFACPEEMIGRRMLDLHTPEDRDRVQAIFEGQLSQGYAAPFESRLRRPDGTTVDVELSGALVRDAAGQPQAILGLARDITKRKQAERTALGQFKLAEAFFNHSTSCLVVLDRDFNFLRVNETYARACRREVHEFVGRNHFEMYPSDAKAIFEEVVRTRRPADIIARPFVFPDQPERGVTYWDWNLVPILDDCGEVDMLVFSLVEVTERKRAEEALRREQEFASALLQSAVDGVVACDVDGALALFNRTAREWHGMDALALPPEEWASRYDLYKADGRTPLPTEAIPLVRAFQGETVRNVGMTIVAKGQPPRFILASGSPFFDAQGRKLGAVVTMHDITELKQAERQLRDYRDRLRSLMAELTLAEERERRRLAVAVHDQIGQRMALVKFSLQSLHASSPSTKTRRSLQDVVREIDQVIAESHSLTFDLSNPILHEVGFEAAVEAWLADRIKAEYGISYTFADGDSRMKFEKDVGITLFLAVREILANVVKHAQATQVDVRIEKVDSQARISIRDNGIGFDPAQAIHFDPHSGGYGLFSLRERLKYLGGEVAIESESGRGTSIAILVPIQSRRKPRGKEVPR